jgi:hypothetical protein
MSIYRVPPDVELFATSRNSDPEVFNSLNWAKIARYFDYYKPKRPLYNPIRRNNFIESPPSNIPMEPGIPMSRYNKAGFVVSRVSRRGDAMIGLVINQRNVEKVEKALKHPEHVDFYGDLNMHSKEHAERWLKNAKKTILNRRKGGANKSRKSGTRKTRKSGKSRKARKARH